MSLPEAYSLGTPIVPRPRHLPLLDAGRILNNWHIEDNFTLFKQMGVSP